ncbi:hypothetical protein CPB85DRAFT_1430127 [Mucidula mucida]|nr:hypothetical protein CPB85DRAFT_1430127 [Mucidula mucida]
MSLLCALSGTSRLTRAALRTAVATVFGPEAKFATGLSSQDNGHIALSITIEEVALARHEDQGNNTQNKDPAVTQLLSSSDFRQTLIAEDAAAGLLPSSVTSPLKRKDSSTTAHTPTAKRRKMPASTLIPRVAYTYEPGQTDFNKHQFPLPASTKDPADFQNSRALRNHLHQQRGKAKRAARAETLRAETGLLAEDLPATSTWWMGRQFAKASAVALRADHACLERAWTHLEGIQLVPYSGVATKFLDASGRLLIYQSEVSRNVLDLLPKFTEEARELWKLVQEWGRTKFEAIGAATIGSASPTLSGIANDLLAEHFPGVTQCYDVCKDYMEKKYFLSPQFGRFWNWCLNVDGLV